MKSIIGKTYYVKDGSYAVCLNNDNRLKRILPACNANDYELIPLQIISNPFKLRVKGRIDRNKLEFILAIDDREDVYSVLYYTTGVVTESKTIAHFEAEADERRAWEEKCNEIFKYYSHDKKH